MALKTRDWYLQRIGKNAVYVAAIQDTGSGYSISYIPRFRACRGYFYQGIPMIIGYVDNVTSIIDFATGMLLAFGFRQLNPIVIRPKCINAVLNNMFRHIADKRGMRSKWEAWDYIAEEVGHAPWAGLEDITYVRACRLAKALDHG